MGIPILITIIVVIFYLGRYAIREGHRIEEQKEFMKNMNNYGNSGRSENDPITIWNKHKRGK